MHSLVWAFWRQTSPWLVFLRSVFLANHLASTETQPKQPKDRIHTNEN